MKKKILVTGAAGFIGSNLCEHLCRLHYAVIGLDNFATGAVDNILRLKNFDNFSFI